MPPQICKPPSKASAAHQTVSTLISHFLDQVREGLMRCNVPLQKEGDI